MMKRTGYASVAKSLDDGDRRLSNQLLAEITTTINTYVDKFMNGVDPDTVDVSRHIFAIIKKLIYSKLQHLHFCPENFSFNRIDISREASSYLGTALKFCSEFEQFSFHNMNFVSDSYDTLFFELSCRPMAASISFDSCVFDPESIHGILCVLNSSVLHNKSVCFKSMNIRPLLDMLESYQPAMCKEFVKGENASALFRDFIMKGIIVLEDCDLSADDIKQVEQTVRMDCM